MTSQLYCDLILNLNKKRYKASTILDFKKTFQGGGAGRVLEVTCFLHNAHIEVPHTVAVFHKLSEINIYQICILRYMNSP